MRRTRHTPEQIIGKLKTAEQLLAQCKTVADVSRAHEVASDGRGFGGNASGKKRAKGDFRGLLLSN